MNTRRNAARVIPAQAGIQGHRGRRDWIPAFAGMTTFEA
jgi:hypothetical protein